MARLSAVKVADHDTRMTEVPEGGLPALASVEAAGAKAAAPSAQGAPAPPKLATTTVAQNIVNGSRKRGRDG
jgi:hypothetical protein